MATLHVRNVPDDLYALLRERAGANDRSIGAETVQILAERLVEGGAARRRAFPGLRRRPVGPVGAFTRFSAEARRAVVVAQDEARALGRGHVGTEHLLLGVLRQDVPAAAALAGIGLTADGVRAGLERGDEQPVGQLRFEPEAKHALELALRESTKLGDTVIAPGHMVLGIAGATAGRGAAILRAAEPDEAALRTCVLGRAAPTLFPPQEVLGSAFRVVLLEGEAADWEAQLNDAAALGYELVEIVDRRAIFRS